jgi:(p)ppGpp synthase/HD superfamily hydrolase
MEALMKKTHELTLEKTLEFATRHYGDRKTLTGGATLQHCQAVARAAETIALKLYQDVRPGYFPDPANDSMVTIVHAALLHDIFSVGTCAFEHVAEITTVQIAAIVADISRDFRLVETKRDMEFRGRLSQSPVAAQIVATADIICTAKDLLNWIKQEDVSVVPKAKKTLTQLDGDLLAVHAANKYYVLRMYVHAARNLLTDISQQIKNCKQRVKLARVIANSTKTIREKAANQTHEVQSKMAAKVKKNGRKKSAPTNP